MSKKVERSKKGEQKEREVFFVCFLYLSIYLSWLCRGGGRSEKGDLKGVYLLIRRIEGVPTYLFVYLFIYSGGVGRVG